MELRDYVQMLKRGWPVIVLITALFVGLASLYLAVAPKQYESSSVLFVSANNPITIDDLQQGAQFSAGAVNTYAQIVDSATVLGPIAAELRPQSNVDEVVAMVTASVIEKTTLIAITASGQDPEQVTAVANAAAVSAVRIIPTLENAPDGRPLVRVQQIRTAVPPISAVSPNVKRVLALGLIVGLSVGLGLTIAAQTVDTRLRRVADIHELTDVPILGVVPPLTRAQRHGLVARDEPTGTSGEAFRTLRTNLRFLESRDRRSLVFTAVADDRNGAQVPANLAWSLAQAGRRVLLVDLDLRHSPVGDAFGIKAEVGLADVLAGRVDLPKVVHGTEHPRLRVVPAGTVQHSPSDLLSAPIMTGVLRRMEQEHDYVILHAPPLLSYTDAAVVSGAATGTFVTIAAGRTKAQELTTALSALGNVGIEPLGLVLTDARRPDGPDRASGDLRRRASTAVGRSFRQQPAQHV